MSILVSLYFKTLNGADLKLFSGDALPVIMAVMTADFHPTENNFRTVLIQSLKTQ